MVVGEEMEPFYRITQQAAYRCGHKSAETWSLAATRRSKLMDQDVEAAFGRGGLPSSLFA